MIAANQNGELLLGDNLVRFGAYLRGGDCRRRASDFYATTPIPRAIQPGSTGSLALGGAIAMMAILSRSIILLPRYERSVFVASIGSIVLQALSHRRVRTASGCFAPCRCTGIIELMADIPRIADRFKHVRHRHGGALRNLSAYPILHSQKVNFVRTRRR